jgi:hypothetical protein
MLSRSDHNSEGFSHNGYTIVERPVDICTFQPDGSSCRLEAEEKSGLRDWVHFAQALEYFFDLNCCSRVKVQARRMDKHSGKVPSVEKMQYGFPPIALKLPLQKRYGAKDFLRVRILSSNSHHWNRFVRTFGLFTSYHCTG